LPFGYFSAMELSKAKAMHNLLNANGIFHCAESLDKFLI
jgi:hypothetical protein